MTVSITAMHRPKPSHRLPAPSTSHPKQSSRALYRALIVATLVLTAIFILYFVASHSYTDPQGSLHQYELKRFSRRTLRLYQRQLHLHPLVSRAITAGVIFVIADFLSQLLNTPRNKSLIDVFSMQRLLRYSFYGLTLMGPFLYVWYMAMHAYGPEDDLRGSLIKCVFEQVTLEPVCIAMYIVYDGIICRKGARAVKRSIIGCFVPLWVKNAIFWLPANFANYYIGTPDLRVVFANLCSLFWNVYFSGKVNVITTQPAGEKKYPILDRPRSSPTSSSSSRSSSMQPRTVVV